MMNKYNTIQPKFTSGFTRLVDFGFVFKIALGHSTKICRYFIKTYNYVLSFFKTKILKPKFTTGFTIVELLIVLGITVLLSAVVGAFARDVFFIKNYVSESYSTEQDSSKIIRPMITELRSARASQTGAYTIEQAGTSSLIFFTDTNFDGVTERVRYYLSNKTIMKGVIFATGTPATYPTAQEKFSTLISAVSNSTSTPIFEYYDDNYTGTSSPLTQPVNIPDIRLIKINIKTDIDVNRAPYQQNITTQVSIRNLKDNY
jgi:Tfp pilus assembly major pilin PilA